MSRRRRRKALRGGVSYWVTDEQLRTWHRVPPERKLAWLEEVNRLTAAAVTGAAKRVRDAMREGTL